MALPAGLGKEVTDKILAEQARLTKIAQRYRDVDKNDSAANSIVDQINQMWSGWNGMVGMLESLADSGMDEDTLRTIALSNATKGPMGEQALREYALSAKKNKEGQDKLADFRTRAETQMFGAPGADLASALSSNTGELGQLGQILSSQQSDIFQSNLAPLINMKMASQGLMESGANIELQSKALGDLERGRQNTLLNAALSAKDQIRGLERSDILGNIGAENEALANMADLQRTGLTMDFENMANLRRESLAKELAQISSAGPGLLQQVIGFGGAAAAAGAAPFTGGMSLAAMPGFLAYGTGGQGQAGQLGQGAAALGQSFFSGQGGQSSRMPPRRRMSYGGQPEYTGDVNWGYIG